MRYSGLVGTLLLVVFWWLLAITVFADSGSVPTPWAVVHQFGEDGWDFYATNAGITLRGAALGFLWGNAAACWWPYSPC